MHQDSEHNPPTATGRRAPGRAVVAGALLVGAGTLLASRAVGQPLDIAPASAQVPVVASDGKPGWMDVEALADLPEPPPTATVQPPRKASPAAASNKVVYLTYDDGPDARYTPAILSLLKANNAHATFFLIGVNAKENRDLVTAIRGSGNGIGAHTWDHPMLTRLSAPSVVKQFNRTKQVIGSTSCMRPPYGDTNTRVRKTAKSLGLTEIMWTVDTRDWSGRPAKVIEREVLGHVRNGSVVLLHDGGGNRSRTVAASRVIIPTLAKKGWQMRVLPQCQVGLS